MNKLIVISGCSSGGKSTLLSALKKDGYTVVSEIGREIVKEQLAIRHGITPWQQPKEFCELLIHRSINAYFTAKYLSPPKEKVVFFDRSFLDGVSYYQSLNIETAHQYDWAIHKLKFYPIVFMAPPWKELFRLDAERRHSFEDALSEYARLIDSYSRYGYTTIVLPKTSVKKRIAYILEHLFATQTE